MNVNIVVLAGNLTRDPAVRFLADRKAVAEFGLAINRRWKTSTGELREEVTFVDIEVWGITAENAGKYLKKGSGIFLEGRLKLDTWEDKKDGSKRSKLRVVADILQFTSPKPAGPATTAAPAAESTPAPATPPAAAPGDDEPPF